MECKGKEITKYRLRARLRIRSLNRYLPLVNYRKDMENMNQRSSIHEIKTKDMQDSLRNKKERRKGKEPLE